jgi:hypothetical protein
MLFRAGQCGVETAKTDLTVVQAVATMNRPDNYEFVDMGESTLYNASTLNLHGLSYYDYASL